MYKPGHSALVIISMEHLH